MQISCEVCHNSCDLNYVINVISTIKLTSIINFII